MHIQYRVRCLGAQGLRGAEDRQHHVPRIDPPRHACCLQDASACVSICTVVLVKQEN